MSTVLHIEDDDASRLLVRKVLTAAGHEVVDADSGVAGIRLAAERRPDLVLVDINIPDLDGYEVTLRLRGMPELDGTPIVAITAEGDREQSLAVGADGFVQKPIDVSGFPDLIERFLHGHSERGVERGVDGSGELLRRRSQKIVKRLESTVVGLSSANEQLEESVRLRQEFLQNLSHEFATPMTPVVGYLKLLLREELGPLTPLQRKCVGKILTSTAKLRALVDTLLDVSHLETGELKLFSRDYDFGSVAKQALSDTDARFDGTGIELATEFPEQELPARGDPDRLRRAMVHILDNAVKFSPRASQVAVAIEAVAEPQGQEPAAYRFIVMDSGPGISGRDRERIFQPFFQVDGSRTRAHGGVGLGLAYARHVAEAMGGMIEIDSPPTRDVAGMRLSGTAITLQVASHAVIAEA